MNFSDGLVQPYFLWCHISFYCLYMFWRHSHPTIQHQASVTKSRAALHFLCLGGIPTPLPTTQHQASVTKPRLPSIAHVLGRMYLSLTGHDPQKCAYVNCVVGDDCCMWFLGRRLLGWLAIRLAHLYWYSSKHLGLKRNFLPQQQSPLLVQSSE